jgi:glycosyltransferase involved in cell wall biosynthesis
LLREPPVEGAVPLVLEQARVRRRGAALDVLGEEPVELRQDRAPCAVWTMESSPLRRNQFSCRTRLFLWVASTIRARRRAGASTGSSPKELRYPDGERRRQFLRLPRRTGGDTTDGIDASRSVLATFGCISPGKGIETAIAAMPAIVERHPKALYLIAGQTHPEVATRHGEEYRISLERLTNDLGLGENYRDSKRVSGSVFPGVFAASAGRLHRSGPVQTAVYRWPLSANFRPLARAPRSTLDGLVLYALEEPHKFVQAVLEGFDRAFEPPHAPIEIVDVGHPGPTTSVTSSRSASRSASCRKC